MFSPINKCVCIWNELQTHRELDTRFFTYFSSLFWFDDPQNPLTCYFQLQNVWFIYSFIFAVGVQIQPNLN